MLEDKTPPFRGTLQDPLVEQYHPKTGVLLNRYRKGKFLGKGGFAKCYQFTNLSDNFKYAAKIIDKATLNRSKAKEKLTSEISIHQAVKSNYVVKYYHYFEDAVNYYILLELCPNQTLNQLIKRRKRITEIQAKYYLRQVVFAIRDMQKQMIIHRDLKLGNLLLTEGLQIRVSDFGLAARLEHPGQRRKTMCGTPNYIAPQILDSHNSSGHSFEVDLWSLGVITYACVIGRPPFETNDVKTTYARIKNCNYSFPDHITLMPQTKAFISKLLQRDPKHRINIDEILNDEFFNIGIIPETLPLTTMACPPNSHFLSRYQQNEALPPNQSQLNQKTDRLLQKGDSVRTLGRTSSNEKINRNSVQPVQRNLHLQRAASTAALTRTRAPSRQEAPKLIIPSAQVGAPIWVIHFEQNPKFGVAYLLNSNAAGMRFNDSTCMIGNSVFNRLKYLQVGSREEGQIIQFGHIPQRLSKKVKIINYYQKQLRLKKQAFQARLNNQQLIARQRMRFRETVDNAFDVFVIRHFRTPKANIFWFSNKDYQVIFQDDTQLLFCRDQVTYVNKSAERKNFNKETVEIQSEQIQKRMKYTLFVVQNIRESAKQANKENRPQEAQPKSIQRSSSLLKIQKSKVSLKGSASTSRIPQNPRILKY